MTDFPAPYAVPVALSMTSHDRIGHRRTDSAWLTEVWDDDATRVVVFAGDRFAVRDDRIVWISPKDAPLGERILLGEVGGVPRFAIFTDAEEAGEDWVGLRQVGPLLDAEEQGLMVHATALAQWHRSHRFCPACGGRLEIVDAGHVLKCEQCGRQQFPRSDPAVIMLVVRTDADGTEHALLGRKPEWPPGRYSTLAGFVDPGESFEQTVVREVMEEAGVEVDQVTYFGNQPWPFPASLMVGFYAHATTSDIHVDGEEIEHARWFTREEMLEAATTGDLLPPGRFSISRALIEAWFGGQLPGSW